MQIRYATHTGPGCLALPRKVTRRRDNIAERFTEVTSARRAARRCIDAPHRTAATPHGNETGTPIDANSLDVSDFSAATDLYQVVGNVYGLRIVPVDMVSVGLFVGATLLPFGVVAVAALPFDVILKEIASLVL